jgi:PHD/YefM family antitoxin component YafN of YafNO toxin-antitoxin module
MTQGNRLSAKWVCFWLERVLQLARRQTAMKRVTLREDRAPYLVDEEILSDEPVIVERNGQAVAAVIPMADYEAFLAWRATLDEPWPGEPPRTSEGDLEALAAVERIRTMFPPVDAETARLLTSPGQFLLDYRLDLEEEA